MSVSTTSGTFIDEAEAAELTAQYRNDFPNARKALFFGSEKIQDLLADSIGIRIYYGINDIGKAELVLVGVDSNGDDILELILDHGVPCPETCGTPNSLNGI